MRCALARLKVFLSKRNTGVAAPTGNGSAQSSMAGKPLNGTPAWDSLARSEIAAAVMTITRTATAARADGAAVVTITRTTTAVGAGIAAPIGGRSVPNYGVGGVAVGTSACDSQAPSGIAEGPVEIAGAASSCQPYKLGKNVCWIKVKSQAWRDASGASSRGYGPAPKNRQEQRVQI